MHLFILKVLLTIKVTNHAILPWCWLVVYKLLPFIFTYANNFFTTSLIVFPSDAAPIFSLADYEKSGREDLIAQIKEEIEVLAEYLPKQLSEEELENIIKEVIEEQGATSMKDMGKVMKAAKEKIGAASDGKTINEVVKKLLA